MESSTLFADQMAQRHQSGQLDAAVQKVLRRALRAGNGNGSQMKKLVMDKLEQLKSAGSRFASEIEESVLAGLSQKISERLASSEAQAEIRGERRRKADTLNFANSKVASWTV